jgi:uncharacterized membrane protein
MAEGAQTPGSKRPRPHRDLVGAVAIWCFALQALVLSALLTLLKFRADVLCDDDSLGACPTGVVAGASACAAALTDPWATVLGLPLSIYSAAFYLVVAVLALLITVGDLRRWMRPLLLLLAWVGLLVSVVLALYSTVALRTLCLYCLFLHGVHLGFFVAARLMNPWGLSGALRQLFADRRALVIAGLVGLGLLTGVSVQRNFYRRAARSDDARDLSPCEVRLGQLVDSNIIVPSAEPPRLMVALFLDFACPHCRADHEQWLELQAASPWPIELRLYQFPATSCDRAELAASATDISYHRSCDAARALHCMIEQGDPSRGLEMSAALFALQTPDSAPPYFSATRLAAVAQSFGVAADPGRRDDPFFACMRAPTTADALVRDMRLAEDVAELDRPPGALLIPLQDGRPIGRARQVRGHKPRATLERWIADLLTEAEPRP